MCYVLQWRIDVHLFTEALVIEALYTTYYLRLVGFTWE